MGQAGLHVRQWRLCARLSNVEDTVGLVGLAFRARAGDSSSACSGTLKRHPDKGGLQGKFPATSACPFGGSYVVGAIQGNCEEIGGAISEWSLPYATAFAVELAQHTKRKTAA